jgi:hypothetical protein
MAKGKRPPKASPAMKARSAGWSKAVNKQITKGSGSGSGAHRQKRDRKGKFT